MRVWIVVAAFLGLAALGLATVPRVIDWNAYRADVEAAAAKLSGHAVTIKGPIELTVLPRLVLTARDVTITSEDNAAIGFELKTNQADVTLEIGPLLAGRPVLRDLRLRRPVLTVDRQSSRRLRSWPPRWQDWAAPFLNLDLKRIGLDDGRIELTGERPDRGLDLRDLSLELQIRGPDGPVDVAGLFETERHRFTVTGEFGTPDAEGASAAKLAIEARNGVDETTSLRFGGRVGPFDTDVGLRGRLTVSGPDLQHGLAALAAATGYPSVFRATAAGQPFTVEGRVEADRRGIRANDLQLRLDDKLGKGSVDLQLHPREQLDLDVELPPLRLADDAGLTDFLPLDLLSKLHVPPGEINIVLREMAYRDQSARQASLSLTTGQDRVTRVEQAKVQLPGLIDLRFEGGLYPGEIGPRLRGRLAAVGDDLKTSLAWLGLLANAEAVRGWRSFSLEGDVDVSSVEIALSALDMRLDTAKVGGEARLRFSERRRLSLDVDVERPNLDLYVADWDAEAAIAELKAGLQALDTDIDIGFTRSIWRGVHVEDGSIRASSERELVTIDEIRATTVGETAFSLEGSIDLESGRADLGATLSSEHPARALHHLSLDPPFPSSRLRPLALTASLEGTVEDLVLRTETAYDQGKLVVEGDAGLVEERLWYDLAVNAHHPDHRALAGQFGLAPLVPEGDAEGAFELAGRLRLLAAEGWIASGNAKLGPTTFTGSLSYPKEPFRGTFDAKLSVGTPQKDSLAPFLILTGLRLAGDWTPARWLGRLPGTGLRTAWIDGMDGSLSLASKGGLVGEGFNMHATLNDGVLYADRIEASPWQGTLQAEVRLERRNDRPFIALAVDLDRIEAADLASWAGVKSGIEGPLDLHLEASSVGRTPYGLMAAASGELALKAGPGEITGLGVPDLRRTLSSEASEESAAIGDLTMAFSDLEAKAELSRGILTFDPASLSLLLDAGADRAIEVAIDGTADLLLWIVDLSLSSAGSDARPDGAGVFRLVGPPGRPVGYASTEN
ncbi:MAG: AsmA family protein [Alphaproteobacteria bacterium]